MADNGGGMVAGVLKEYGVNHVFTLCGGHIAPILVACHRLGIRVVDVRHEASAVFAADAAARMTGLPGVAVVTAGPGITNTITALQNARMAQSPLLVLGGAVPTVLRGRGALQDIDQLALLQTVVKSAASIRRNCDIAQVLAHAFETAQSGVPGPVFVECPIDLLYPEELVRGWYGAEAAGLGEGLKSKVVRFYLDRHLDRMFACDFDQLTPEPLEVEVPGQKPAGVARAAELLKASRRPVMIVGSQALLNPRQANRLAAAVARIGMPVYLTGMARGLLGPDHPLLMRHRRKKALQSADLVLIAGMPCDFRLGYGRQIHREAKLIAVNRSKTDLNLNRRPELGIHGDPMAFLLALAELPAPGREPWTAWIKALRENDAAREREIEEQMRGKGEFINPLSFLRQLDAYIGANSVIVVDGGDFAATAAYILRPRAPLAWLDPGVFGTLGVGAGFALGAGLSHPDAEVWLIYGDGAAGFSLMEMDTFVRHRIPVIAVVGNDAAWSQIARDQVAYLQDDVATGLERTAYHTVAEGLGARGFCLGREAEVTPVLAEARKAALGGRPALVNVLIGATGFRQGSISM